MTVKTQPFSRELKVSGPVKELGRMHGILSVFVPVFLLVMSLLFGTHLEASIKPEYGGTVTIALARDELDLDPLKCNNWEEQWIHRHLYESLFAVHGGEIKPCLAREWSRSDNGTFLRIRLREGIHFSNNKTMTARDVQVSLQRAILAFSHSKMASPLADLIGFQDYITDGTTAISGIIVHSATEIELQFTRPQPLLLYELSKMEYAILAESTSGENNLVGTGPFRLSQRESSSTRICLEANPSYYRGRPYLDKVVFLSGNSPERATRLFEREQVDLFFRMVGEWQTLEGFMDTDLYDTRVLKPPVLLFLDLNTDRDSLQDIHFRQVLQESIDLSSMFTILLSEKGSIAPGVVSSDYSPYFQLFDSARPRQSPPSSEKPVNPIIEQDRPLTFLVPDGFPVLENIAGRIQVNLLDRGFNVVLRRVSLTDMESRILRGTYDCALRSVLFDWTEPVFILEQFVRELLRPPIKSRFSLLKPIIDRLVYYQAERMNKPAKPTDLFDIERGLVHTWTAIPLFHPHFAVVKTRKLRGLDWTPTGMPELENAWLVPETITINRDK